MIDSTVLAGKVVVITGGTAGIGHAVAKALAPTGASLVLIGRSTERARDAAQSVASAMRGGDVVGWAFDVRDEEDMSRMATMTLERFGRIDMLVAAAGVLRVRAGHLRTAIDTPVEEWDEILDINLKGTYLSNRAVLPAMIRQRAGVIINVSSTSGRRGYAFDSAYCASKFGVIGLSQALAEEVRHHGVRVETVLPGAIDTQMWDQNGPIPKPTDRVSAREVARLVVVLASMPADTVCPEMVIEPLKRHEPPRWLAQRR